MASQSVTNKLVANIKQATNVSTNFFRGTNVVCIDTSNRRIGIDTKTPTWSIDISGVESYNGVKCHNLDISGKADISYALINFLKTPTISADFIGITDGSFDKLDVSLIDVSYLDYHTISGNFIYSNNTISGNFIQCFSAVILNDLSINGTLTVENFTFEKDVSFNEVNVDLSLTTQSTSNSLFQGTVDFSNSNPVTYITLSGNHINTFSISCDNLQVNQQADFSSINVSAEASFNTINVIGEASFNTISAESINIRGQSLENFVNNETASQYSNFNSNLGVSDICGKRILIHSDITGPGVISFYNKFYQSFIDNLVVKSLDFSTNDQAEATLKLPYDNPVDTENKGCIYYNQNTNGTIESISVIKDNNGSIMTLSDNKTKSIMLTNKDNVKTFVDLNGYECINLGLNTLELSNSSRLITSVNGQENIWSSNYISIPDSLTEENIEINANITVKLNNNNGGKDVDALNYRFYILGVNIDNEKFTYVENINSVLVFDNSYNYSSSSLNYIGPRKDAKLSDLNVIKVQDVSYIYFGISYEYNGLGISLESFSGSIKTII